MESGKGTLSSRKAEAYRRAAQKKTRNIFGLFLGIIFIGVGIFINDIIVFGGILVAALSILNLYASIYAEKQLRIIGSEAAMPIESPSSKPAPRIETKECIHCRKQIPVTDRFCGECGKKLS